MTLVTRTLGRRAVSIRGRAGRRRDSVMLRWSFLRVRSMLWAPWRLLESPVELMFPDGCCREVGWLGRWAGGAARPTAVRSRRRYTPDLPRCAIVPRGPRNCSRLTSLRVRSDGKKRRRLIYSCYAEDIGG